MNIYYTKYSNCCDDYYKKQFYFDCQRTIFIIFKMFQTLMTWEQFTVEVGTSIMVDAVPFGHCKLSSKRMDLVTLMEVSVLSTTHCMMTQWTQKNQPLTASQQQWVLDIILLKVEYSSISRMKTITIHSIPEGIYDIG